MPSRSELLCILWSENQCFKLLNFLDEFPGERALGLGRLWGLLESLECVGQWMVSVVSQEMILRKGLEDGSFG